MRVSTIVVGVVSLSFGCTALPQSQSTPDASTLAKSRAVKVHEAFQFAWNGYYTYAFPNDELHPVTNGYGNSRNGWGASAVDALSTAIVMQDAKIVNEILNFVPTINFGVSKDDEEVSVFESTIRYIAGLISAHDFLTGPLANLTTNQTEVAALLNQAQNLANFMSYAFDTPSGVPSNYLFFGNRSTDGSKVNGLATIGTLVLEWTRLSDLTGNKTYAQLAQKGESYLLNPLPTRNEPFPGLLGTNVGLKKGRFRNAVGGWIGGDDSFYEYLIKMYVYDPSRFASYKDRWILAVESSMQYLASHPSPRPDLTYLAFYHNKTTVEESEHLACFDGGNFILGGSVLGRSDISDFGLQLVAGCHNTYTSTATGIGPEIFGWNATRVNATQAAFFQKNGFYIVDSIYDLRPEVIESYYYAYQYTKNPMYQQWAWDAFVAINATCRVGSGFAAINNVNVPGGGGFIDNQESFLFAEVMKYSYLIQAPDEEWDFNYGGKNGWVYNTEAHPFKVAGTPI